MTSTTASLPAAQLGRPSRVAILWGFARPHAPKLVFALFLGLGVAAAELATPLVTRWVLDAIGASGSRFTEPILLLAGLIVAGTVMSWCQWVVLGTLAENVVYGARQGMVQRFLLARVLPLQAHPTGELVTRVTSDSVLLREAASSSVVGLVNSTITLFGTLVMMVVLHPLLGGVTIGAIAVIALVFVVLMPGIARAQERAQDSLGNLGGALESTLRAIKTVKVAAAEHRQADALLAHAAESRQYGLRAVRREALVWSVAFSGIQAATLIIVCGGAYLVSTGQMTMSTLVAFLLYAVGLLGPTMELSNDLATLQAGIAAAGRIHEVQVLDTELDSITPPVSRDVNPAPVIAFDQVTARYHDGGPTILHDVSLEVPSRGHTAIVGPSGAGKTTLFSLILKFIDPESGRLSMAGTPYCELGIGEIRGRLGYVEQDTPLLPGSLRDNLVFTNPEAAEGDIAEVLRRVHLTELAEGLDQGLDTDVAGTNISGGQRQRIALARALLGNPEVLLLDEATAQIDGLTESAVHQVIREQASAGAVLTIAHRLSTVIDADTIVVMNQGQIVDRGRHCDLLTRCPLYRRLVDSLRLDTPHTGDSLAATRK
ncbi:ABC transporter ATP-binding protein [Mycobacterium sp. D16R24]|uniref:ABC transporter ATP-binding protein n=1 Tax=Mycobacterium sp. D16R24 TaxID=1855656 RepID=UPI002570D2E5|nr:ABC transporter ATP-binding protein [Mycobacterium sp. D16R24]